MWCSQLEHLTSDGLQCAGARLHHSFHTVSCDGSVLRIRCTGAPPPPTTTTTHPPPTTHHPPPTTHHPPPTTHHQHHPTTHHQPPTTNHQPPNPPTNHHPAPPRTCHFRFNMLLAWMHFSHTMEVTWLTVGLKIKAAMQEIHHTTSQMWH